MTAEDHAYVAELAAQAPPLTQEQALAAARILISLPPPQPRERAA